MHQPIYDTMDKEFESFVNNNRRVLEEMEEGDPPLKVKGKKEICSINMFEDPYNVVFLYKKEGGEGYLYHFLDKDMDKIYTYYDVE